MDIEQIGTQAAVILIAFTAIWMFMKAMKFIWKITVFACIFAGLLFTLPVVREWTTSLF